MSRLLLACVLALLPISLDAQEREVVSNQLAISQNEAGLVLEFDDDETLEIALRGGAIVVDGGVLGSFERGDPLDTAWRELLGQIVNLSDGALAEALREWEPPASLSGSYLTNARLLDESLEDALAQGSEPVRDVQASSDSSDGLARGIRTLLRRTDLLGELGKALEAIDMMTSSIHIGEDVIVSTDETIEQTMVVVDGRLTVSGRINADVVIVDGSITVEEGGNVEGDIRLVDSRYFGIDESELDGRVIRIDPGDVDVRASVDVRSDEGRDRIEDQIRSEIRDELRREYRDTGRGFSPFRAVAHGVGEVMGDLLSFLILSLIALGVVYFANDNLEMVADTARRNPMRAGMVGVAGAFLVLPAWLLGCVALVVSIVGILALPFWLLLFPVAVALGVGLGLLAAAKNIGEWVAERDINGLEWVQPTNTFYAIVTGIGTIMAFSVAANVLDIVPLFGLFSGLIAAIGSIIALAAVLVGFGAVLLTRGGRQPEFYGGSAPFDESPWSETGYSDEVLEAEEEVADDNTEARATEESEAGADTTHEEVEDVGDGKNE